MKTFNLVLAIAATIALVGAVSSPAQAQASRILANTAPANARVIVPDGSSLSQTVAGPSDTRWFVFGAEPGKTYAVEVVDPYSDIGSSAIGSVDIFDSSGASPPPESDHDCTMNARAPALAVASNGIRCIVRTFMPNTGNTVNKRGILVAVGTVSGPNFEIRVRESTIYGRWTTTGYEFHVELQNTTADSVCAQIVFLPNSGNSYSGTWSGGLTYQGLTVPAFGANKYVLPNSTTVGSNNDKKGTLRIGACTGTLNFVPGALHVSTYAYNPVTDKFLYFFTSTANSGAAANSW